MLKRLKTRREFLRVARARHSFAAPGLVLQVWRRDDRNDGDAAATVGEVRVGFTVSRKVGGAVERNRARRRLRAAAEQVFADHAESGRDYVVIGRRATLRRPFDALVDDLETALKRVGAFRDGAMDERRRDAP